jgi:hypothetical protein
VIESNEVRTVGAFAVCAAMYSISSSDASQIIIEPYSDAVVGKRVCVRAGVAAGADKTGYCAVFGSAAAGNWTTVDIIKDGAFVTSLFPLVADQTTSHTLKITASGTSTVTITGIVDGSTIGTVDDSSTPDGTGKPGFLMIGNGDAAVTGMGTWTDAP